MELIIDTKAGTYTLTGKLNGKTKADLPASTSLKSLVMASENGPTNVKFDGDTVKVNLNIYVKNPAAPK